MQSSTPSHPPPLVTADRRRVSITVFRSRTCLSQELAHPGRNSHFNFFSLHSLHAARFLSSAMADATSEVPVRRGVKSFKSRAEWSGQQYSAAYLRSVRSSFLPKPDPLFSDPTRPKPENAVTHSKIQPFILFLCIHSHLRIFILPSLFSVLTHAYKNDNDNLPPDR
jgi:hypothetical protein